MDKILFNALDPQGMYALIKNFPAQAEEAVAIGEKAKIPIRSSAIKNIVVTGLGGSAIGGDLLKSYLAEDLKVPFAVNRHYYLPKYVDKNTLVIASSYSGGTEETISSLKDAVKKKAKVLCITSGGVVNTIAGKKKYPVIAIPGGLPPRAALGYSFFPTLIALSKIGLIRSKSKEIEETIALLKLKSIQYADHENPSNPALAIAQKLHGKLPVVYSAADRFDAVNVRWRGQISENAKTLAYGHVFPELNHNEIVGWEVLKELMKNIHVIILRDKNDYARVQLRMDITKEIIKDLSSGITEVESEGSSLLARMFSLLYLGDWASYYLAILNGVDPTPVKKIDFLKKELAKVS